MDRDPKEGRLIAEEVKILVEKIIKLYKILKKELDRILEKITIIVNKKRSKGLDFKEGEIVYINMKNIKIQWLSKKLDYIKIGLYRIKSKIGLVIFKL